MVVCVNLSDAEEKNLQRKVQLPPAAEQRMTFQRLTFFFAVEESEKEHRRERKTSLLKRPLASDGIYSARVHLLLPLIYAAFSGTR